jgi:hypothetical protein
MTYSVQFVGLVCFVNEQNGRKVFLPDGRKFEDVEPHYGSIVVEPSAVRSMEGWSAEDRAQGTFPLDPCTISLQGADVPGTLDTSDHDGLLPQLKQINPAFVLDPSAAQTIARLEIRQGTLAAYRVPGGTALISQLDVEHEGEIQVTVQSQDGTKRQTLTLAPGTEIAIANMAKAGYDFVDDENGHFRIYEQLSAQRIRLSAPTASEVADVPPSRTSHAIFRRATPIGLSTTCSNTGCCTP